LAILAGVVVALVGAALALYWARHEPPLLSAAADRRGTAPAPDVAQLRRDRPFNVVIVSLDTTRADRLGAYGFAGIETPAIDALAAAGILFQRAYSPVPLTLPAHASLFTGAYPFDHGVRDNTGFAVADELTTTAELFVQNGYRTAAFVASYVLLARWGLDQGFDTYVDGLGAEARSVEQMNDAQRPADEVVDDALAWLDSKPAGPFFLWVHLYDAHVPYAPPEPYRSRYADDPYAGEIAFMDEQVGRLMNRLEADGETGNTFVVIVGDHGESLGEHGENEHGLFVYEAAIRIPLILSVPFEQFHGLQHDGVVSLIDVMPTVLQLNGIAAPAGIQGRPLPPLFAAPSSATPRTVYSETYYARLHYGWSALTSMQDERYKLIISPDAELYDIVADPGETVNLIRQLPDVYDRLEAASADLTANAQAPDARVEVDAETRRALEGLGYIAGPAAAGGDDGRRATPRAKIDIFNKSLAARTLMAGGDLDGAARLYNEILDDDPDVLIAYERLGEIYMLQERFAEAAQIFSFAVPLRPDWSKSYIKLAEAQIELGQGAEAEQTLLGALQLAAPTAGAYCLLGYLSERKPDYPAAIEHYRSCSRLDPESPTPRTLIANAYLQTGDLDAAEDNARRALALDESAEAAHFTLAHVYSRRGDAERAVAEYLAEVSTNPDHVGAHFGLAMKYGEAGRTADEERHLERILQIDPEHPLAALFLANILLARGTDYERAVALATAAVDQPLPREDLAAGYSILANLHQRLGNTALAQQYLQRAESLRHP